MSAALLVKRLGGRGEGLYEGKSTQTTESTCVIPMTLVSEGSYFFVKLSTVMVPNSTFQNKLNLTTIAKSWTEYQVK